jgi:phosphatidylglycerol:prolipoprotein diacylglycerol transferase
MFSLFPSRTVAIDLFGFSIRWYGLLYLLSFLVAFLLVPRLQKYRALRLASDEWSRIISAAVIGVIVGGRLGYVLFYQPAYYVAHPLEIFAVWNGGMASHGGFIGVTIALLYVLRKYSWEEIARIADVIAVPIILGLGIGRIGNFINQELYGTITTLPWGISIPDIEGLRHPVQLYEFGTSLVIAALCYVHLRSTQHQRPGRTLGLFLTLYGLVRILLEFIRIHAFPPLLLGLYREQVLTIPLVLIGLFLLTGLRHRTPKE